MFNVTWNGNECWFNTLSKAERFAKGFSGALIFFQPGPKLPARRRNRRLESAVELRDRLEGEVWG